MKEKDFEPILFALVGLLVGAMLTAALLINPPGEVSPAHVKRPTTTWHGTYSNRVLKSDERTTQPGDVFLFELGEAHVPMTNSERTQRRMLQLKQRELELLEQEYRERLYLGATRR